MKNKKIKKIISASAIGLFSASPILMVQEAKLAKVSKNNIADDQFKNNNQKTAPDVNNIPIYSSSKFLAQSSAGGTFGISGPAGNENVITMTTYNNVLAWNKSIEDNRIFKLAKQDNFDGNFDSSNYSISSLQVIEKVWKNNEIKEILYVVLKDSNGKTCVLPYDSLSGEDIITVIGVDNSIDWRENLFLGNNDRLTFNKTTGYNYLSRWATVSEYKATPAEAFFHYYGKGFQKIDLKQDFTGLDDSFIIAGLTQTNSQYLSMMYIDTTKNPPYPRETSQINQNKSLTSTIIDKNFTIVQNAVPDEIKEQIIFPIGITTGVDLSNNTSTDNGETPTLFEFGFPLSVPNDTSNSYVLLVQTGAACAAQIFKINNQTGLLSIVQQYNLDNWNVPGWENNNPDSDTIGISYDLFKAAYDEDTNTFYFSCSWSNDPTAPGRSIYKLNIQITDGEPKIQGITPVSIDDEGRSDNANSLRQNIAIYKSDESYEGVMTYDLRGSNPQTLSALLKEKGTDNQYRKFVSNTRSTFQDFQERANAIWLTNSTRNEDAQFASNITKEMILNNPSTSSVDTGASKNFIVATNQLALDNATFDVENIVSNDDEGTLSFSIIYKTTMTSTSPITNSEIFITLSGFRLVGSYTFEDVFYSKSNESIITSKKNRIDELRNMFYANEITPEIIMQSYENSSGGKESPFWNSNEGSYFNDIYSKIEDGSVNVNDVITITSTQEELNTGKLRFEINFESVTPDSLKSDRNNYIKEIYIEDFATEENFIINFLTSEKFNVLPNAVNVNYAINNFIDTENTGKGIVTSGLTSGDDGWLVDSLGIKRWKLEWQSEEIKNDTIYMEDPVPNFKIKYNKSTSATIDSIVVAMKYVDGSLYANPNTSTISEDDNNTSGWTEINYSFKNIYNFFGTTDSPISNSFSPSTSDQIYSIIQGQLIPGVSNEENEDLKNGVISDFTSLGFSDEISPYTLWNALKNNESINGQDPKSLINSFLNLENFGSFQDIFFIENGEEIPESASGGLVVICNNVNKLGGAANNQIKEFNGVNRYYSSTGELLDSYLDLNFKIIDNTETTIPNTDLNLGEDGSFVINDKFQIRDKILNWNNIKLVKTNVQANDYYFSYNVKQLQNTVNNDGSTEDIQVTNAIGDVTISLDDILNSGIDATNLSKDKTLDEMDSNIFSTIYTENPLIDAKVNNDIYINVIKDNDNGVASIIVVVEEVSPDGTKKINVDQTITIVGFKKPISWLITIVVPITVSLIVLLLIISLLIMKKVSKNNLKKFISNK